MSADYQQSLSSILQLLSIENDSDIIIESLTIDSRQVQSQALFFAYPGGTSDGRDYIEAAQQAGAVAVIYEASSIDSEATEYRLPESITIPAFAVSGLQSLVGRVAHEFFGRPSTKLQVFGVTGTNGKTSCCYLLMQALTQMGMRTAMIGTIGNGVLDQMSATSHTTPDPISVHRLLAEFASQEVTQVCMEVSSHALDQGRVNGVNFFCTLFTNLSHDHLDYHGDMRSYAASKQRLFTDFHSELVISNADDELGATLPDICDAEFVVSFGQGGDVKADDVQLHEDGISMFIEGSGVEFSIRTPLVGKVNIPNITMLAATLLALSSPVEQIQSVLAQLKAAPGRMELYSKSGQPKVVVDYAHTPDALEKALLSIQEHCHGKLWCVFGCGGDRDQTKRPVMGATVEQFADHLIVTNDNPRSEKPKLIADQVLSGVEGDAQVILDRAAAIREAISQAKQTDWVLIAGKGHEATQEIGDVKKPFSDRQQVLQALGLGAAA